MRKKRNSAPVVQETLSGLPEGARVIGDTDIYNYANTSSARKPIYADHVIFSPSGDLPVMQTKRGLMVVLDQIGRGAIVYIPERWAEIAEVVHTKFSDDAAPTGYVAWKKN